jgi:Protein of unknown function (DUF4232)
MNRLLSSSAAAAGLAAAGLVTAACGGSAAHPAKTVTITTTPSPPSGQPASPASASPPGGGLSTTPTTAAAAGCLSRYLHGATGLTQGTAGAVGVVITFKNLNNQPCTLYGFPGVAQAAGTPVTDIGLPSTESATTPRELVTLQPGGYANATLLITDAGSLSPAQCKPKAATWLAVIPPNQQIPLYIPYKSTACQGKPGLLTVTAVRPGNGG